jgi:hypothetical protein
MNPGFTTDPPKRELYVADGETFRVLISQGIEGHVVHEYTVDGAFLRVQNLYRNVRDASGRLVKIEVVC